MEARGVDQKFFRNAAADHAGTAEPEFLGQHDLRPVLGGNARRADAARTASDYEKIRHARPYYMSCPRFFISARILLMTSSESLSAQLPAIVMLSSADFGSSVMTFWPSGD